MTGEFSKPFKILSLDGGGIRGVISAQILQEVENQI
jgi:patatin-like phospholipase/acyl hydrolase